MEREMGFEILSEREMLKIRGGCEYCYEKDKDNTELPPPPSTPNDNHK